MQQSVLCDAYAANTPMRLRASLRRREPCARGPVDSICVQRDGLTAGRKARREGPAKESGEGVIGFPDGAATSLARRRRCEPAA